MRWTEMRVRLGALALVGLCSCAVPFDRLESFPCTRNLECPEGFVCLAADGGHRCARGSPPDAGPTAADAQALPGLDAAAAPDAQTQSGGDAADPAGIDGALPDAGAPAEADSGCQGIYSEWTSEVVESPVADGPTSIALDPAGNPVLLYFTGTDGGIVARLAARGAEGGWDFIDTPASPASTKLPAVALAVKDQLFLAHSPPLDPARPQEGSIHLATRPLPGDEAPWTDQTISSFEGTDLLAVSVDPIGKAHVAYEGVLGLNLVPAVVENVDMSGSVGSPVALTYAGTVPWLAYYAFDTDSSYLFSAHYDSSLGDWVKSKVFQGGITASADLSVAVVAAGSAVFALGTDEDKVMIYSGSAGTAYSGQKLDNLPRARGLSLAADGSDVPHVVFADNTRIFHFVPPDGEVLPLADGSRPALAFGPGCTAHVSYLSKDSSSKLVVNYATLRRKP